VSLILYQVPVIIKGPRHMVSFAISLLAVQSCPWDFIVKRFQKSLVCRAALRVCCALYKQRKAIFAIETAIHLNHSAAIVVLACYLAVDGSSFFRRHTITAEKWRKTHGLPSINLTLLWEEATRMWAALLYCAALLGVALLGRWCVLIFPESCCTAEVIHTIRWLIKAAIFVAQLMREIYRDKPILCALCEWSFCKFLLGKKDEDETALLAPALATASAAPAIKLTKLAVQQTADGICKTERRNVDHIKSE